MTVANFGFETTLEGYASGGHPAAYGLFDRRQPPRIP